MSFRIGDAHISIANDITKQVSVFSNGQLVRTMPTSMGMGGSEIIGGRTISFWTQPGIYTVMDKSNPVVMGPPPMACRSTRGWVMKRSIGATRISTDGIYLHQLEGHRVGAGATPTSSHGCLNLSADNARWFYGFSQPGDVGGHQHRRSAAGTVAERRLGVPWAQWQGRQRCPDHLPPTPGATIPGNVVEKQGSDGQPPR